MIAASAQYGEKSGSVLSFPYTNSGNMFASAGESLESPNMFDTSSMNISPTEWTSNVFNSRHNLHEKTPPAGTRSSAHGFDPLKPPPSNGISPSAAAYFFAGTPFSTSNNTGSTLNAVEIQRSLSQSRGPSVRSQQSTPVRPSSLPKASRNGATIRSASAQDNLNNSADNSPGQMPKNPKLYKTELCRSWMDSGRCNYGDRCQYAHGENEKRPIPRHPKYKTEACQSYHKTGYCPYGPRCHFIHNEEPHILAQMVAQNAVAAAVAVKSTSSTPVPSGDCSPKRQSAPMSPSKVEAKSGNSPMATHAPLALAPTHFDHYRPAQHNLAAAESTSLRRPCNSTGESPVPSSVDSGTESPLDVSFSPGLDLDENFASRLSPSALRRSLDQAVSGGAIFGNAKGLRSVTSTPSSIGFAGRGFGAAVTGTATASEGAVVHIATAPLSTSADNAKWSSGGTLTKGIASLTFTPDVPLYHTPIGQQQKSSSIANDSGIGSIFSSGANSPGSPPGGILSGTPPQTSSSCWSVPNASIGRLPIFERLSNGPTI